MMSELAQPQAHAIDWQWRHFNELSSADLYTLLAERQQVFVLEQQCLYGDIDGLDQDAHHLLGWRMVEGKGEQRRVLAAYLRLLAPGVKFAEMSLGRIFTTAAARGNGAGRELVAQGILHAERLYPGQRIRIDAQAHLETFYGGFGFVKVSDPYDEDGILHIEMLR